MPRSSRGGKRQGTPGKGYSNRTDLQAAPNMGMNTAATGGMPSAAPSAGPPPMPSKAPEDSPMLSAPTNRPGEPVTAGLDFGAGPGSDALGMQSYSQQKAQDIDVLKKNLPLFQAAAGFEGAPETFKGLVNYLSRL